MRVTTVVESHQNYSSGVSLPPFSAKLRHLEAFVVAGHNSSPIIRFGIFEVDLNARELRRSGLKIRLQEQPFQVLTALLERRGEVVSREDLRTRLWPADTFVDFEHSLNAAIRRLRDALGESASAPVFIETLARRGYRFVYPIDPQPDQTGVAVGPELRRPTWGLSNKWVLTAFGVLVTILLAIFLRVGVKPLPKGQERIEQRLTANPSENPVSAAIVSPDGKYLVFSDQRGMYVKMIHGGGNG